MADKYVQNSKNGGLTDLVPDLLMDMLLRTMHYRYRYVISMIRY